jgi:hypothetical protein
VTLVGLGVAVVDELVFFCGLKGVLLTTPPSNLQAYGMLASRLGSLMRKFGVAERGGVGCSL